MNQILISKAKIDIIALKTNIYTEGSHFHFFIAVEKRTE